jgi:hypothetical protein
MVVRQVRSSTWVGAVVALLALVYPAAARADSFTFDTEYQPNVINLYSNVPFSGSAISGLTGAWGSLGWGVTVDTSNFVQLVLPSGPSNPNGYGSLTPSGIFPNMLFNVGFNGTTSGNTSFAMDFQEVYWNTTTNTLVQGVSGSIDGSSAPGGYAPGTYGSVGPMSGGQPLYQGPVGPEPSSLLAFALALGCAAFVRRRRLLAAP